MESTFSFSLETEGTVYSTNTSPSQITPGTFDSSLVQHLCYTPTCIYQYFYVKLVREKIQQFPRVQDLVSLRIINSKHSEYQSNTGFRFFMNTVHISNCPLFCFFLESTFSFSLETEGTVYSTNTSPSQITPGTFDSSLVQHLCYTPTCIYQYFYVKLVREKIQQFPRVQDLVSLRIINSKHSEYQSNTGFRFFMNTVHISNCPLFCFFLESTFSFSLETEGTVYSTNTSSSQITPGTFDSSLLQH